NRAACAVRDDVVVGGGAAGQDDDPIRCPERSPGAIQVLRVVAVGWTGTLVGPRHQGSPRTVGRNGWKRLVPARGAHRCSLRHPEPLGEAGGSVRSTSRMRPPHGTWGDRSRIPPARRKWRKHTPVPRIGTTV